VEVQDELAKASRAATLVAIGGVSAILALGLFLACAYALALVLQLWLAVLIVSASTGILAAVLILRGMKRLRRLHLPTPTTIAS
jgi:Kef-type K+ transport system membrane component KefB